MYVCTYMCVYIHTHTHIYIHVERATERYIETDVLIGIGSQSYFAEAEKSHNPLSAAWKPGNPVV